MKSSESCPCDIARGLRLMEGLHALLTCCHEIETRVLPRGDNATNAGTSTVPRLR